MSLKFVPPPIRTLTFPKYATYIPHLAAMKSHTEMSAVKNRINYQCRQREELPGQEDLPYYKRKYREFYREAFILENVDGEWYTLYHVPEGCEEKDLPWMVDSWVPTASSGYYWERRRFDEPTYKPENYRHEKFSRPMTRDEYVAWRIKVELERRGISE